MVFCRLDRLVILAKVNFAELNWIGSQSSVDIALTWRIYAFRSQLAVKRTKIHGKEIQLIT